VYLGEIIAAVGVVFARPHVLTAILLLAFVGLQWWRTVFEERALAHAFPGEYPSYQMGVSRLLPRFRLSGEKHVSSVPVT
jgi:protein-S-isoprenylcysteine O-methyltransferase Ste14